MSEYIEREKLLEELEKIPVYFDSGDTRYGIEIAIDQIKKQPTADVIEVVRCKDCEYYTPIKHQSTKWKSKTFYCTRNANMKMNENDFCSCAKLKELK